MGKRIVSPNISGFMSFNRAAMSCRGSFIYFMRDSKSAYVITLGRPILRERLRTRPSAEPTFCGC